MRCASWFSSLLSSASPDQSNPNSEKPVNASGSRSGSGSCGSPTRLVVFTVVQLIPWPNQCPLHDLPPSSRFTRHSGGMKSKGRPGGPGGSQRLLVSVQRKHICYTDYQTCIYPPVTGGDRVTAHRWGKHGCNALLLGWC